MDLLTELGWLKRPPKDIRSRFKLIEGTLFQPDIVLDTALVEVATYALDINQLTRVSKLAAARLKYPIETVLTRFKLGFIGSGTTSLIAPAIVGSGLRYSTLVTVVEGDFGRALEESLNPGGSVLGSRPDGVLLALDYRDLHLDAAVADSELAAGRVSAALSHLQSVAENIRSSFKGPLLVQTVVPPMEPLFGSLDASEPGTSRAMVTELNARIATWMRGTNDVLVDVASLADTVGLQNWHDPAQWHAAKLPFAQDMVPLYADFVCRTIAAIRGKSRKCLVLDLDNTLWGGVVGDDGLDGIVLGQGTGVVRRRGLSGDSEDGAGI